MSTHTLIVRSLITVALTCLARSVCAQSTEFVSINPMTGVQWPAGDPGLHTRVAVSGDGNRVVFCYGPFPGFGASGDVFVRTRSTPSTSKMNIVTDGSDCGRPDISGDGSRVAWVYPFGDGVNPAAAYTCTVAAPATTTEVVSVPSGPAAPALAAVAQFVALSDTGNFVAFTTSVDLIPAVDGNGMPDVYLRDRAGLTTVLCSRINGVVPVTSAMGVSSGHVVGPSISSDGRYVVFESTGELHAGGAVSGLMLVQRFDRLTGTVALVSVSPQGPIAGCMPDGHSGATIPGAGSCAYYKGGHDVSADGRWVTFWSCATNLRATAPGCMDIVDLGDQVFVKDMLAGNGTGPVELISYTELGAPAHGMFPRINKLPPGGGMDGRYVFFLTEDPLAIPEDDNGITEDVYRRDRFLAPAAAGATQLISVSLDGTTDPFDNCLSMPPNEELMWAYGDISALGNVCVWYGKPTTLVLGGDANGFTHDVFARQLPPPCTVTCPAGSMIEPSETASCGIAGVGLNGGCNSAVPAFTPIFCGATVCGNMWAIGGTRDTDWYEFTLAVPTEVTWSVRSTYATRAFLISKGPNGCTDRFTRATANAPGCSIATATAILPAGTHWAWAGPDSFAGVPCDTLYVATMTCAPVGCCSIGGTGELRTAAACAAAGGVYSGDGVSCPPPINDPCAGAIPLSFGVPVTGDTRSASLDAGVPSPCDGNSIYAPGVWYTLVGNGDTVTLSMCAQNSYDSQLFVYGGPCDSLTCIASNDDFCQTGGSSQVTFCALMGRTYRILVAGWSYSAGLFTLVATDTGVACGCIQPVTTRVSLTHTGAQAQGTTTADQVTPDGRYVVLHASGPLVAGDTNSRFDIVVRDLQTGTNERVSVATGGAQSNDHSEDGAISDDGRFISFTSAATNLVAGDTNATWDVFFRDRLAGTTTRIMGPGGVQPNNQAITTAISGDGAFIAFTSLASNLVPGDANTSTDVFVYDRVGGGLELASRTAAGVPGAGSSNVPRLSADGRYVTFDSGATNLVAGDTNGAYDVFRRDRVTGVMTRVSVTSTGAQATGGGSGSSSLSSDGRYVAFSSLATNLVAGDTNAAYDVFVKDMVTGQVQRISVSASGAQGNGASSGPTISPDGTWIAFSTSASNLVPGDTNGQTDVVVKNRLTGAIERVSIGSAGAEGNDQSWPATRGAFFSAGRRVVFNSWASTLVPGDTNNQPDTFIRDRGNTGIGGPTIWVQPTNQAAACGSVATFSVFAEGSGPTTYQWRINGMAVANGASISGATSPTLTINPVSSEHSRVIDCIVTDACAQATSGGAAILGLCYANCDCSTGSPLLTPNDFQCFLDRFAAGSIYANCDGSTGTPALTPNDFQCFLNVYAAGCP